MDYENNFQMFLVWNMIKPSVEMHLVKLSQLYKWCQDFYWACLEVSQKII